MEVLESRINPQDPQFQQNAAHNRALTSELRERLAQARSGGGELAQKRHAEQGKLLRARAHRQAARPRLALPGTLALAA